VYKKVKKILENKKKRVWQFVGAASLAQSRIYNPSPNIIFHSCPSLNVIFEYDFFYFFFQLISQNFLRGPTQYQGPQYTPLLALSTYDVSDTLPKCVRMFAVGN